MQWKHALAVGALVTSFAPASQALPPDRGEPPPGWDRACRAGGLSSSPLGLALCMRGENVHEHLQMLQDIANANDGNRASGTPGYRSSVDYVRNRLLAAGYEVNVQPFEFLAFYPHDASLEQTAPTDTVYERNTDFVMLSQTDPGEVEAAVTPVDLDLGRGNSSTSGCETEDFADFPAGNIALIQRGACAFGQKAENAAAAGASGAIIFNQGNTDERTGLINATLGGDYSGGIPVLFATYGLGEGWAATEGLTLHMMADVTREVTETYNVIAETRSGDPDNTVMVGAHLDSVIDGPGINDNGSGSAAILELALLMQRSHTANRVRFAWWGAEESGLLGSTHYVENLDDAELERIGAYLNFDMIGSPNGVNLIYDGDGSAFGLAGPPGSGEIEALFEHYFNGRGEPHDPTEISFRSDYAAFFEAGIPFGGLFTGAEVVKTEEEAERFGGTAGEPYDPCYHQACDTLSNVDVERMDLHADGMALVTGLLAWYPGLDEIGGDEAGVGRSRALTAPAPRERAGHAYLR